MPVKPYGLLDYARSLLVQQGEYTYRSAIGKAYYSSYHQVLSELENNLFIKINQNIEGGVHVKLIRTCEEHMFSPSHPKSADRKKALSAVSNLLSKAKSMRVRADYDLHKTVTVNDAKQGIFYAEQIFIELEKCVE